MLTALWIETTETGRFAVVALYDFDNGDADNGAALRTEAREEYETRALAEKAIADLLRDEAGNIGADLANELRVGA